MYRTNRIRKENIRQMHQKMCWRELVQYVPILKQALEKVKGNKREYEDTMIRLEKDFRSRIRYYKNHPSLLIFRQQMNFLKNHYPNHVDFSLDQLLTTAQKRS